MGSRDQVSQNEQLPYLSAEWTTVTGSHFSGRNINNTNKLPLAINGNLLKIYGPMESRVPRTFISINTLGSQAYYLNIQQDNLNR